MNTKILLFTFTSLLKMVWIIDAQCVTIEPEILECDDNLGDFYNETQQRNYKTLQLENLNKTFYTTTNVFQHLKKGLKNLHNLKHLTIFQSDPIAKLMLENLGLIKEFNLTKLNLTENGIRELQPYVFDDVIHLETLSLRKNLLNHLPENIFANLKELKEVDLAYNQFTSIPHGHGKSVAPIENLNLYRNWIENITEDSFSLLKNLKHLDLTVNRIDNVAPNSFSSLVDLEELGIGVPFGYEIVEINLRNLTQLKNLTLTNADDSLIRKILLPKSLEKIKIHFNDYKIIPISLYHGQENLYHLHLSHGYINTIPKGIFFELKNLKYLNLYSNLIENIKDGTFDGASQLISLNLGLNEIHNLQTASFQSLTSLQELFLGLNSIAYIPHDFFRSMINLRILNLEQNRLNALPEKIFEPLGSSLSKLNLNQNIFSYIPASILKPLQSLHSLSINWNRLTHLEDDTLNLPSLVEVDLSSNQLTYLPRNTLNGNHCKVEKLNVKGNQLAFVEDKFFENTNLKNITLGCNPWIFKCLNHTKHLLESKNISFYIDDDSSWCQSREKYTEEPSCVFDENRKIISDSFYSFFLD